MKHITQQEVLQLIKDKKASPHILKPYIKEEEDEESLVAEIREIKNLLAESIKQPQSLVEIRELISAFKDAVLMIANRKEPSIKVENIIENSPYKCNCKIIRDADGLMTDIEIREA